MTHTNLLIMKIFNDQIVVRDNQVTKKQKMRNFGREEQKMDLQNINQKISNELLTINWKVVINKCNTPK